jgi:hypothetical protein
MKLYGFARKKQGARLSDQVRRITGYSVFHELHSGFWGGVAAIGGYAEIELPPILLTRSRQAAKKEKGEIFTFLSSLFTFGAKRPPAIA